MVNENRLSDSQYPMLMGKKTLVDYLGVSVETIDKLIRYEGLDVAVWVPRSTKRIWFIKPKVDEWLTKL